MGVEYPDEMLKSESQQDNCFFPGLVHFGNIRYLSLLYPGEGIIQLVGSLQKGKQISNKYFD